MNILVISGILPLPGIERSNDFVILLYKYYLKNYPSDKVYIIRPTATRNISKWNKLNKGKKSFDIGDFKIFLLPYFSTWRWANFHSFISSYSLYWLNRKKLKNLLKEWKIDIIQSEYIIPDGYLAYAIRKRFKIPYLVTSHNEYRYFDTPFSRRMVLKILENASFITPLNYISLRTFEKYSVNNVNLIPLGIDQRFLEINPDYEFDGGTRILSIGALIALKNFDNVLHALSGLKEKYRFTYTIVGSGPEYANLNDITIKLGLQDQVKFVDLIPYDQIPSEMGKYDLFIMPSYFETFGRVFFEALAAGLPIIYAKNTGIHGYFKEGEVGYSVTHNDIKDIEEKLSILMNDKSSRILIGKRGKELMRECTWDNIVSKFNDLYKMSIRNNSAKSD